MKREWKSTIRAGGITGLVLASLLSPMFLVESLPCSPVILIGFAALFPVAGFVAGRKATAHPVWASVISALVASLGILILGLTTAQTSGDTSVSSGSLAHVGMLLAMARVMFQMWIQQTAVLTALSTVGGALALFINRKKMRSSIGIGTPLAGRPSHITDHTDRVISDSAVMGRMDQGEQGRGAE